MTNDSLFTRRRMLQVTGGTALFGLAGCTGAPTSDGQADAQANDPSTDADQHDEGESAGDGHDDGEDGHDEAVGAPADTAEVTMASSSSGEHFEPHVVRVNVGGTVTWTLESGSHTTTAYHPDNDQPQLVPDGAAAWDSGYLSEEGATFEHTFETEGVYHYYCIPHETLGMLGSVIVGEPDPHDQVALQEPPAEKPDRVREKLTELNEMVRTALGDDHE